jgi:anti-repressor protein
VTRDIEKMFKELEISALKFEHPYQDSRGKVQKEYLLTKKLTLTLVSGYSVKIRSAIIDRWQELENAPQFILPGSYSEALRALADTTEEKDALALEVKESKPKVEFFDRVVGSSTVCPMATAVKLAKLPFGRNILLQKLREDGVLMSRGKNHNLPKQYFIERGLFTVQESPYINKKTQKPEISFTPHVTQKGIDWLIKKYGVTSSGSQLKESGS